MSFLRKFVLCAKPQSGQGHSSSSSSSSKGQSAQDADGADGDGGSGAFADDQERAECAVCQDAPTDPCTVPCGNRHVFCLQCLRGLVLHNHYTTSFPCPLCRERVKIPLRGLAALQDHKGWSQRLLSRLAVVRPRCSRYRGDRQHSWASSDNNSVGSGASWPPRDHLLDFVLPLLQGPTRGGAEEDGEEEEEDALLRGGSAFLDRIRLGQYYVDTLTLTRQRAGLDSLNSSVVDVDDDNNDVINEEDEDAVFELDAIDVELQRQILEEIEREVIRVRHVHLDHDPDRERRGGDPDRLRPSFPPPPPAVSSPDFQVAPDDNDVNNEDGWEGAPAGLAAGVGVDFDVHGNTAPPYEAASSPSAGSGYAERTGAKGPRGSPPAPARDDDTDSLDMNCVMELIADMERTSAEGEAAADASSSSDQRPPSGKMAADTGIIPDDGKRKPALTDDAAGRWAGRLSSGGGGSAGRIGARAGRGAARSWSDRRSRSGVQSGPWQDENWRPACPTRFSIPRPMVSVSAHSLAESQTSLHSSQEAAAGRPGTVTTV